MRRRRIPGAQPRAAGAGAGGASERPRAGSPSAGAPAAVVAAALARISLHRLRRALGSRLRFALVASGGWEQPVPGEYAARLDPAHLGLGRLRVGGVGEWTRSGEREPFRVLAAMGSPQHPRGIGERRLGDPFPPGLGARPPRIYWDKCARSPTPFPLALSSRRKVRLAEVAARSPGMRARESQFCLTAEAPEVTPNFFAVAGVLRRGPRRT